MPEKIDIQTGRGTVKKSFYTKEELDSFGIGSGMEDRLMQRMFDGATSHVNSQLDQLSSDIDQSIEDAFDTAGFYYNNQINEVTDALNNSIQNNGNTFSYNEVEQSEANGLLITGYDRTTSPDTPISRINLRGDGTTSDGQDFAGIFIQKNEGTESSSNWVTNFWANSSGDLFMNGNLQLSEGSVLVGSRNDPTVFISQEPSFEGISVTGDTSRTIIGEGSDDQGTTFAGISIQKNIGTVSSPDWQSNFYADANGDVFLRGEIVANSGFLGTLIVDGTISSTNYDPNNNTGFQIDGVTGNAEFNDVTARGDFIGTFDGSGSQIEADSFQGLNDNPLSGDMSIIAYEFATNLRGIGFNSVDDRLFYKAGSVIPFWVDTQDAKFNVPITLSDGSSIASESWVSTNFDNYGYWEIRTPDAIGDPTGDQIYQVNQNGYITIKTGADLQIEENGAGTFTFSLNGSLYTSADFDDDLATSTIADMGTTSIQQLDDVQFVASPTNGTMMYNDGSNWNVIDTAALYWDASSAVLKMNGTATGNTVATRNWVTNNVAGGSMDTWDIGVTGDSRAVSNQDTVRFVGGSAISVAFSSTVEPYEIEISYTGSGGSLWTDDGDGSISYSGPISVSADNVAADFNSQTNYKTLKWYRTSDQSEKGYLAAGGNRVDIGLENDSGATLSRIQLSDGDVNFQSDLSINGQRFAVRTGGTVYVGDIDSGDGSQDVIVRAGGTDIITLTYSNDNAEFRNNVIASDFEGGSDRRIKENIQPIENALSTIRQAGAYTFLKNGESSVGYIADELMPITSNVVKVSERHGYDDFKSMGVFGMQAYNTQAIKELDQNVMSLQQRVEYLEQQVKDLGGEPYGIA